MSRNPITPQYNNSPWETWNLPARKFAQEIWEEFGIPVTTYDWHGYPARDAQGRDIGKPNGVDWWVSPIGIRANKQQEALGDQVQRFVELNWGRLRIIYIIWWGWINEGNGWYRYDPSRYDRGNRDHVTQGHFNHGHGQFRPTF